MVSNDGNMFANMSANNKRVQLANLMAAEKAFLTELALKYQAVIENKKSDEAVSYTHLTLPTILRV